MKKITSVFIAVLLFIVTGFAQVLSPVVKNSAHLDPVKLAQIDSLLNTYVANKWLVGVSTIIVKDNQVVYYKGHGYADRATKKPMDANSIFRIMSQTKAITSLAVLQLFEKGKIGLDQAVGDFIPSFYKQSVLKDYNAADTTYTTVPAKRNITIRDLLTHTSGIDYAAIGSEKMKAIYAKAGMPSGLGKINGTLLEHMKVLGTLPLVHQPGEKFTYGLNSDLLGCIVEQVSGMTLEAYCHKYIFEPMGMQDTYFNVPAAKANRLPKVYTEDTGNNIIEWGPTFRNIDPDYPLLKTTYFSGGAGLSSTAYDYAIFLQMILNGGKYNGKQIISPRTAALMVSPQLDFKYEGLNDFSLGFAVTSEKAANLNARNKGSFSWGGYYGTTYWADPKENLICLIMTQHTPNSHFGFQGKIENIIYGSLVK
ncbi:MAG: serine hydrolase domain-containing protein [Sediminibacterium sp.]|jgi:CubicO group peptidase (beta-lactamase class C family)